MATESRRECSTCRYWDRPAADIVGRCRRHPPCRSEKRSTHGVSYGVWPFTEARDWCGEWEQQPEAKE